MNAAFTQSKEKRHAITLLAGMTALYFFSYFNRVAIPGTIFNEIQADMGLSAAAVTALGAIFLYIYGGSQLFIGILADRYGGLKTLLAGGVFMCAGSLLFPLAHSLPLLYFSRALAGFGSCFMYLCIIKELDRLFGGANFAPMMGVAYFIGFSGGLFGTLPYERLARAMGWRQSLFAIAILSTLVLALIFHASRRQLSAPHHATEFRLTKLWQLFRNRPYLCVLTCATINYGLYFTLQATIGKKFLEDYAELASSTAATVTSVMMIGSMATAVLSGVISRLCGNRRKGFMIVATLSTLIGCILLAVGIRSHGGGWYFAACYVLLALSAGFGTIFVSSVRELCPSDAVGVAVGVINSTVYLFIAGCANFSGAVLNHFANQTIKTATSVVYPPKAYATIFGAMAVLAAVSFASSLFTRETYGRHVYE
jgi:MFS family permease